jgi:hypothetical protein
MFDNFIFAEYQLKSIQEERIANSRNLEKAAFCKAPPALENPAPQTSKRPLILSRQGGWFKFVITPFNFFFTRNHR